MVTQTHRNFRVFHAPGAAASLLSDAAYLRSGVPLLCSPGVVATAGGTLVLDGLVCWGGDVTPFSSVAVGTFWLCRAQLRATRQRAQSGDQRLYGYSGSATQTYVSVAAMPYIKCRSKPM